MTELNMPKVVTKPAGPREWEQDGKPHPGRRMTEREFVEWADSETRAEWVDGEVIVMAPDSLDHEKLAFWLRTVVQEYAEHHELGEVIGPTFTVRLPRRRRRRVPDLLFVAAGREGIIGPTHVEGAPDLIMEIVSPDSVSRDWREKFYDYERGGVREYWVIDRQNDRVEAHRLSDRGRYERIEEDDEGRIASGVLRGFYLRPAWVLADPLPGRRAVLRELGVR